jgi:hypothetical protein
MQTLSLEEQLIAQTRRELRIRDEAEHRCGRCGELIEDGLETDGCREPDFTNGERVSQVMPYAEARARYEAAMKQQKGRG